MLAGKAGQKHELACDRDRSRSGDEGCAPLGDAGVEEDKDHFVELGALLAVGEGPGGFRKVAAAGLAEEALKTSIFEIFAGKIAFSDGCRGMTAVRTGHEWHLLEVPLLVSGGGSLSDKGKRCSHVDQFAKGEMSMRVGLHFGLAALSSRLFQQPIHPSHVAAKSHF